MTTTAPNPTDTQLLALLDQAAALDLTSTHLRFLLLINSSTEEKPMASPTVIAERMDLSIAAVGEIAKLMQSRKLITRDRNHNDDRRVTYKLTPAAIAHLKTIRTAG